MRARKRFGQHFLHDPAVIRRIIAAVAAHTDGPVVEIGPGRGALTQLLLELNGSLDAIEIDRDLAALLRERFARAPRFVLHETDALDFDFAALARERGARLRIVANLPYNISTPLLFHLLGEPAAISDMHLMLQREVVDRLVAPPGGRDYGRLTVMLAPWVHIERLFDIGPGAFSPPPRVWSAMVHLTVRAAPTFTVSPHFSRVVTAAFAHRRKTLRNALKGLVSAQQIAACALDGGARPETLPPEAFNALARTLDACAES
ncbi:MAG TPA: 16S rRNA (adenine(1518)-N(6)/adenine(1519)-N(6))-dimethyltransferase RsmA [Steroidobacteraceae bacterium]|jgi:16S rRNA (adenine1518-N6/adenine1519-N6)-dimethyltransferase